MKILLDCPFKYDFFNYSLEPAKPWNRFPMGWGMYLQNNQSALQKVNSRQKYSGGEIWNTLYIFLKKYNGNKESNF